MRKEFSVEFLELIRRNLDVDCVQVSDSAQLGLRARIHRTDPISFWVRYKMNEPAVNEGSGVIAMANGDIDTSGPFLKLGELPAMTVDKARRLAALARSLASEGIDPKEALAPFLVSNRN